MTFLKLLQCKQMKFTQHALRYLAFGQTWKVLGLQDDKIVEEEEESVDGAMKRQADGKEDSVPDTKKMKLEP